MESIIMAIATVFIAIFSMLTWRMSRQIMKDSTKRDAETEDLFISLVAAILASGQTAGDPELAADHFVKQKNALRQEIEKSKEMLAS